MELREANNFSVEELHKKLVVLRGTLEPAFSPETAVEGTTGVVPSAGHCAATAAIVQKVLGGGLVSAIVNGTSHWFNRFEVAGRRLDADITGDQFGLPAVRIASKGDLFLGTRERRSTELNEETRRRAAILARKSGLLDLFTCQQDYSS